MYVSSYIRDNDYFAAQLLIMLISYASTNKGRIKNKQNIIESLSKSLLLKCCMYLK